MKDIFSQVCGILMMMDFWIWIPRLTKSKTKIIWERVPQDFDGEAILAMIPTTILILSFAILTETA